MYLYLQKVNRIPSEYRTLKQFAMECIERVEKYDDAKNVFKTERVQTLLRSLMDLLIESLLAISQYYSKRFWSMFLYSKSYIHDNLMLS